ncbi:MAG TPA: type I-E CRISPR-associated protein Cas7/Cse4/CasC [Thermoanaerobaculia bacterium]|nr:type I-E CRISPR-associated protein Cas7/Cse4/CasC [Thermoanaerobaculia bacterium]
MSEFIQIHALTVYPPGNLNRDDLGRPKTAIFGGTQRLRISSQSLKRAWRTSEIFSGALTGSLGSRTKEIGNYAYDTLVEKGVASDRADEQSKRIAGVFGKIKGVSGGEGKKSAKASKEEKADKETAKRAAEGRQIEQLAHIGAAEMTALDGLLERIASGDTPSDDECAALLLDAHGAADIALFGRMLASTPQKNVDAAVQVAHAITVHKVTVEDDYFTAVDDLNDGSEDAGAAHIGTTEFASGVFYQYICINRSLLEENLAGNRDLASLARRALVEACTKIAPSGKQNSFATRARAVYMLAERGDEQPRNLAMAFLKPVTGDDLLESAIRLLEETRDRMDRVYGPCAREHYSFNVPAGEGSLQELLEFVAK